MVRKPTGDLRLCFDARKLNGITKKDSYTLPRTQDLLRRFNGAKYFSTLDLASGYWQIPLDEDSMEKTAFITRFGLYEFTVMCFGLVNAPASFQRLMDLVLGNLRWECACCYVDDVIIYSGTWVDHLRDLDRVLQRIEEAGLSIRLNKCQFGQQQVKYLGHVIDATGHHTDPAKIEAITKLKPPKSREELQSVMGLFGYDREFIANFADIAEPLAALNRHVPASDKPRVKKKDKNKHARPKYQMKPWQWGEEEQKAFDTLKQKMVEAPVLCHPDFSGKYPFKIETDASSVGLGAILSQQFPDGDHVIGYYSYTLKDKERGWSTTEREAYAIIKALRTFRPIIAGSEFTVVTDHQALRYLHNMKDPHGRIGRWIMEMEQYSFTVDHRSGKSHLNADAMSRPPVVQEEVTINAISSPEISHPFSIEEVQKLQQQDPVLQAYCTFLRDGTMSSIPEQLRSLLLNLNDYTLVDDVLYHLGRFNSPREKAEPRLQLVVPAPLRPQVLQAVHDSSLAGHRGVQGTYDRLRRSYYWVNMYDDVVTWVHSCLRCGFRKRLAPENPKDFILSLPLTDPSA